MTNEGRARYVEEAFVPLDAAVEVTDRQSHMGDRRELTLGSLLIAAREPNAQPSDWGPLREGFVAEPGQCWSMIHDRQGQATPCVETPTWRGAVLT
jgi:hypothetical protein